jgi:hypothetical protein
MSHNRVAKILGNLRRAGVTLSVNGERLAFVAPSGAITHGLRADLARCKAEIIAVLKGDYLTAAVSLLLRTTAPGNWRDGLVMLFDERMNISDDQRVAYIALSQSVESAEVEFNAMAEKELARG